ncbi:MAG: hypothetical protein U1F07_03715 [Rubrivivax sp.]
MKAKKSAAPSNPSAALRAETQELVANLKNKVRESTRNSMLAMIGAIACASKAREERMAKFIAEGKRVEPKIKKTVEGLKAKLDVKGRLGTAQSA